MMTVEEYRRDPCGKLSIPLWKWNAMTIPENMVILHDRDYTPHPGYREARFFRLAHDLKSIPEANVPGLSITQVREEDYEQILRIIRAAYPGIRVDRAWLESLTRTPVYAPELWLIARLDGAAAGCVLADYDAGPREGILEWVQVLPEFRRRGVGKAMVCEVLRRMTGEFATVSGDMDNESSPEALYRSCGFAGEDVWHILTRE